MKKSALILLVAVAISTVSCVDNAVSPQVEAIRTQQVEWMKAKTAGQVALNDAKTALNTHEAATNAILLKTDELTYAVAVADNATALKAAEVALANAKLNLQTALISIAVAVANSGDIQAQEYLANYTREAGDLATLTGTRLTAQNALISNQLLLKSPNVLADLLKNTQATIDADVIKLAAENATLVIFSNAVAANSTTSLTSERSTLLSANSVVNARIFNLTANKGKLDIERNPLLAQKIVLENEKSTYRSPADDAKIAEVTAKIDVLIAKIAPLTVAINTLNTSIIADNVIVSTNNLLINNLSNAISNIGFNAAQLSSYIVTAEKNIAAFKTSILENQKLLLINNETKAIINTEAAILASTKLIATTNIAITAQEKIVAYWKALLDKIFTA